MKRAVRLAALPLLLALPALPALAADGYVIVNVSLRAGPDVAYPWITTVPAGAMVSIQGCIDDWGWCDVIYRDDRGWIAGNYLQYEYDQRPVLVPQYGVQIGIPVVTFVIGDYWGRHYTRRPFYRERERWYREPIRHRPPPPPPRAWPRAGAPHGQPRAVAPAPTTRPAQRPERPPMPAEQRPGPVRPPPAAPARPSGAGKPPPAKGKPSPRQDKDHRGH